MVPMMLLVPVLASAGGGAAGAAAVALVAGAAALAAILVLARAVLPRLLALVARARTPELFPLAALVVAFGTALGAARLGLPLPIGAFLAGLALDAARGAHGLRPRADRRVLVRPRTPGRRGGGDLAGARAGVPRRGHRHHGGDALPHASRAAPRAPGRGRARRGRRARAARPRAGDRLRHHRAGRRPRAA